MVQTIVVQLEASRVCRAGVLQAIEQGQVLERPSAFREAVDGLIDLEDEANLKMAHRVVEALHNAEDVAMLRNLLEAACMARGGPRMRGAPHPGAADE